MMMTRSRLDVDGPSPYLFVLGFADGAPVHEVR